MATNRDNLDEQIRKQRERVTRKIASNRREHGIIIAGTSEDPRVSREFYKTFTTGDKRVYLHELTEFLSRKNQYVAGKNGTPLPRAEVRELQSRQAASRAKAEQFEAALAPLKLPSAAPGKVLQEHTIGAYQQTMVKKPHRNASQSFSPYASKDTELASIESIDQLRAMNDKMEKYNKGEFLDDSVKAARAANSKTLAKMGLEDDFDELSDFQFATIWYGTGYRRLLYPMYEEFGEDFQEEYESMEPHEQAVIDANIRGMKRLRSWGIESVPEKSDVVKFKGE